jgi:UDPglucose 6-dehydrogenase
MEVAVMEVDKTKLDELQKGRMPICEPSLDKLMMENVVSGQITFIGDLPAAGVRMTPVFLSIGTAARRDDGHPDLTYVYAAAEPVTCTLAGYAMIVTKLTKPEGIGHRIAATLSAFPALDFDIASNPEFQRKGNAAGNFIRSVRVVIGTELSRAWEVIRRLCRPLYLIEEPASPQHRGRV